MTNSISKSILAAGALALAVTGSALAFGHGMRGGGGCGAVLGGGGRIFHALDLSADQQQQVRDILTADRPTRDRLAANEKAARQALADKLLGTGTVAQQDLDALAQQESQARTALVHDCLATALEIRKVLTPAQLQKAATIRAGMKQLHAQMQQLLGAEATD